MRSRAFILLGVVLAVLLIASIVAAETAQGEKEVDKAKEIDQVKRGGRCQYGCCGWGHRGCMRCCKSADETPLSETEAKTNKLDETKETAQGGRCKYGCCRRDKWGGCAKCC